MPPILRGAPPPRYNYKQAYREVQSIFGGIETLCGVSIMLLRTEYKVSF
jgi:hypothetical protein